MGEVLDFVRPGTEGPGAAAPLVVVVDPDPDKPLLALDFDVMPFGLAFGDVAAALQHARQLERLHAFLQRAARGIERIGTVRVIEAPEGLIRIVVEPSDDLLALIPPMGDDPGTGGRAA